MMKSFAYLSVLFFLLMPNPDAKASDWHLIVTSLQGTATYIDLGSIKSDSRYTYAWIKRHAKSPRVEKIDGRVYRFSKEIRYQVFDCENEQFATLKRSIFKSSKYGETPLFQYSLKQDEVKLVPAMPDTINAVVLGYVCDDVSGRMNKLYTLNRGTVSSF